MTKEQQRKEIKDLFINNAFELKEYDLAVQKNIMSMLKTHRVKSVFCFLSKDFEPDTIQIIYQLLRVGVQVSLPKCVDDKMIAVLFDEDCALEVGAYGCVEPQSNKVAKHIDTVLVPLVAFDSNLNRLGRGKGFYDKFLSKTDAFKIGVAYSMQQVQRVITEPYDINLDCVVTEKGVFQKQD